jgi:hypothetical protein
MNIWNSMQSMKFYMKEPTQNFNFLHGPTQNFNFLHGPTQNFIFFLVNFTALDQITQKFEFTQFSFFLQELIEGH